MTIFINTIFIFVWIFIVSFFISLIISILPKNEENNDDSNENNLLENDKKVLAKTKKTVHVIDNKNNTVTITTTETLTQQSDKGI